MNVAESKIALERAGYVVNPNWNAQQILVHARWLDAAHLENMRAGRAAAQARLNAGEGFLYVARVLGTNIVKIGHALDTTKRMKSLKADYGFEFELMASVPAHFVTERRLHRRLRKHRHNGGSRNSCTEMYHISILAHEAIPDELRAVQ